MSEEKPQDQESVSDTDQVQDQAEGGEAPAKTAGGDEAAESAAAEEPLEEEINWEDVARSRYDQLIRLQADFDNFRRRMDREREEIQGRVAERLLSNLLPVFDNLERALAYMPTEGDGKAWRVGVEMTLNGFLEALAGLGVKPIEAVGTRFDPHFHEAVQQVESSEPEGTVVEEVQRGFIWNDRVLRASLVKVSTGE